MPPVFQVSKGVLFGGIAALVDVEVMSSVDAVLSLVDYGKVVEGIFPLCVDGRPHLRIPMDNYDTEVFAQSTGIIYDFIRTHSRNESTVLVHCVAGHNRSAAVMLFYLLHKDPEEFNSVSKALAFLERINPEIHVEQVYLRFLENYFFSMSSTDDS